MPSTIGEVAEMVAIDHLGDQSYTSKALRQAYRAYLSICSRVPFPELEVESSYINFVVDQSDYDIKTLIDPTVSGIMSVKLKIGSIYRKAIRKPARFLADVQEGTSGQPSVYVRLGHVLKFHPVPNSATDQFKVTYWRNPDVDVTTAKDHTMLVSEEWIELIEWETLYRMYMGPLNQPESAHALMYPNPAPGYPSGYKSHARGAMGIIPRLWNDILATPYWKDRMDMDMGMMPRVQR